MNKIEDIFDVLLEGTKAQIDALEGCGASYRYSMESGTFTVSLGRDEIRAHKLFDPPACTRWRGFEHAFIGEPASAGIFCRQKKYVYIYYTSLYVDIYVCYNDCIERDEERKRK